MRLARLVFGCLLGIEALACAPDTPVDRWATPRTIRSRPDATTISDGSLVIDGFAELDAGVIDAAAIDAAAIDPPAIDAAEPDTGGAPDGVPEPDAVVEPDAGPDVAPDVVADLCAAGGCKRVFVSSEAMPNGGLGSVARADATCMRLAAAAELGGVWRAWLSDARSSPAVRFTQSPLPYRLIDGTQVAASFAALTSGTLEHAIDLRETGEPVPAGRIFEVWTGTTPAGSASGVSCGNWTNNSPGLPNGEAGLSSRRDRGWTQAVVELCSRAGAHIYCFEQ